MITPEKAAQLAEASIVEYALHCQAQTPDDVRKALEILISMSARAIEKYAGTPAAVEVLNRTTLYIQPDGGKA